jgi:hypothetical protein
VEILLVCALLLAPFVMFMVGYTVWFSHHSLAGRRLPAEPSVPSGLVGRSEIEGQKYPGAWWRWFVQSRRQTALVLHPAFLMLGPDTFRRGEVTGFFLARWNSNSLLVRLEINARPHSAVLVVNRASPVVDSLCEQHWVSPRLAQHERTGDEQADPS